MPINPETNEFYRPYVYFIILFIFTWWLLIPPTYNIIRKNTCGVTLPLTIALLIGVIGFLMGALY